MNKHRLERMNQLLASMMVLYIKLNNYHWNVRGQNFFKFHEALEKFYDDVREQFDAVAEKIVMYNTIPVATMHQALEISLVKEVEPRWFNQKEICKDIVQDCATVINLAEQVPSSPVIQPMLDELNLVFDKARWMFYASGF